jgi:DNA-binding transcriptional regulator YiaG
MGMGTEEKKTTPVYDVRELRHRLGMTQERLAQYMGVSFATINRWERGRSKPSPLAMQRLRDLERMLTENATQQ